MMFNNVMYYSYLEAMVVHFLMKEGGLDWTADRVVPLAVETLCKFSRSLSYPDVVEAGLKVVKMGNYSVTYGIGLFTKGEQAPAAQGYFVHVFVDKENDRPVSIPDTFRDLFQRHN